MRWLACLAVLLLFLFSGAAGYAAARAELVERYAPGDPRTRHVARLRSFSTSVALGSLVLTLLLVWLT